MTDDNSTLVDMDDLDKFSDSFYGKTEAAKPADEAPVEDENEEADENGEDTPAADADEDASSDEPNDDDEPTEEEEETPAPKKGKKSAKDRIEELYANNKRLERELAALKTPPKAPTEEVPTKTEVAADAPKAPSVDDLDEDGEPLYPLREFDKNYIRDLTRFTIDEERAKSKAEDAKEAEARRVAALQEELTNSWAEKVAEAEKELPDLREHLTGLEETFSDINPLYGEYLAATIMSCDHGPEIMYYFSQNIGEAQKIVNSGHAAATLAIGRLDASLAKSKTEEKQTTKRVSHAPQPAQTRTRGSGSKTVVGADTDDLDAFEREFFKRK